MEPYQYNQLLRAKADRAPFDNQALSSAQTLEQERRNKAQRESEEYAKNFARTQLISQFVKNGDSEPIALKKAYDAIPSPDPKVMAEVFDAAKKASHPKEFVPITIDGQTYNSNAITGEVKSPYKTPDSFTTTTNASGIPVQINSSGRQYPLPSIPNTPIDTSRHAIVRQAVLDQNKNELRVVTNTPANILNQYDAAIRSPLPPAQPSPVSSAPDQLAPNEVKRLLKDGKSAIFDATTKQFLRYAD